MDNFKLKNKLFAFLATVLIMGQTFATPIIAVADEINDVRTEAVIEANKEEKAVEKTEPAVTEETTDAEPQNSEKNADSSIGESANANDSPIEAVLPETQPPFTEPENSEQVESESEFETLQVGADGALYYKGEPLFVGAGNEIIPANLDELMKAGVPQILSRASVGGASIEYRGQISYGGTIVGDFAVNGKQAFCLQHPLPTPGTGTPNNGLEPYKNDNIKRILYFGWEGPANIFSDRSQGIVVTSVVLSKYYNGDISGASLPGFAQLDNLAQNGTVPDQSFSVSKQTLSVNINGGLQKSESVTFNAWSENTFNVNVPNGMTLVNETTGSRTTNGVATIKGGQKIHLEASLSYTNNWTSNTISGSMKEFQPLVIRPQNGSYQDIGTWRWYDDPTSNFNLKANFFAREGWLNLVKKGNDTTQNIAGAQYQILQNNAVLQTVTTAADGTIKTKGFLPGNYQVKEIKAPNGYLLDKTVKTVTVRSNETTTVTFTNIAVLGQFVLFKQDAQTGNIAQGDASLVGAEFDIVNAAGTVVDKVVIAPDGSEFKATSKPLPLGNYKRVETKAPLGYVLDPTPVPMELKYETQEIPLVTTTDRVNNQVILGKVEIQKYYELIVGGGHLSPEPGAEFTVTLKSSGVEYGRKETDAKGHVAFDKLPYGRYVVSQTKSLPGLIKVDDFEVEVTEDGATYFYAILNNTFTSPMKIVKADADTGKNVLVPGTLFEITIGDTDELYTETTHNISQFETNENGEILLFNKMPFGEYKLHEIKAPDGYVKNTEPMPFTIDEDSQENGLVTVTFKNKAQVSKITLTKTGEVLTDADKVETDYGTQYNPVYTQKPLEGAEFEFSAAEDIYTNDGTLRYSEFQVVDSGISDAVGQIVTDPETKPFYPGKYYAVEKSAPNGYVVDPTPIPFEVVYEGEDIEISSTAVQAKNKLQELLVKIYKTEGAVITWEDGQPVVEQVPSDGKVFGVFARDAFTFDENDVIPADGLLAVATTTDGIAEVQAKFPQGKFYVKELDAGDSHLLDETEYEFEFRAQDNAPVYEIGIWKDSVAYGKENMLKIARYSIENELATAEVELVKVDVETDLSNEIPLANVPFQLIQIKDGKEEILGEYQTDVDGKINVPNVPVGDYKFREVKPLEGYLPLEKDIEFSISLDQNGTKIFLKAINKRIPPSLRTLATGINGEKNFDSTIDNTIVDDIFYENVITGQEMPLVTELYEVNPDGSFGKKVLSQEETVTFTQPNGTHRVTIFIPKGTLDPDKDYVFVEKVYRDPTKEILYVEHNDPKDKDQTIHTNKLVVPAKPIVPVTPTFLPQTGEENKIIFMIAGLVIVASVGAWFGLSTSKKKKEEKKQEEKQMNMALTYGYSGPESIFTTEDDQGKVYAATCLILSTIKYNYKFKSDLEEYKRLWEKIGLKDEAFSLSPN
ncbi:MAG: SpaA isopeptide-forming pilin-related protein [Vagococcus sp.]|uniref:SpaA isopeptide-forming pilin-related protein n=1 Tax=Vagococcus sp. TaxID=1933889 RepID=UPI002FC7335C